MPKIIVGLSGGVDSAVACKLLLDRGLQVEAAFMKNWEEDDTADNCTAAQDLADAQQVAKTLGIKLHTVNFAYEYWQHVFQYFLAEYKQGRTPNPDVICNKEIKFKQFLNFALSLGADKIATGHYARIKYQQRQYQLWRGIDNNKDQSYFLYLLNQRQLQASMFPLGELCKPEIRNIAQQAGFANANKKDSTGICFIGERNFRKFLQQYLPAQPGDIKTSTGTKIGEHSGLMYYTLGQRKGLAIGGHKDYPEAAWYVLHKDLVNNILVVDQNPKHPQLTSHTVHIENPHWINARPNLNQPYLAQIRYRQSVASCQIINVNNKAATIKFTNPQYSVTPGQSLVLYATAECLGGGVISASS